MKVAVPRVEQHDTSHMGTTTG